MSNSFQDAVAAVQGQASPDEVEPAVEEAANDVELDLNVEAIETEEVPTVEAPNSWSKNDKEQFSTLPHETQVSIANRERDRDLNIRQSQDKVAEERKAFEADQSSFSEQKAKLLERMDLYGPKAPSKDMLNPEHESYDTDAYHFQKAQFEDHQGEMKTIEDDVNLEQAEKRKEWQMVEIENYKKVLPEFVDVEKGPAFRQELAEYATKALGISMEQAAKVFPTTSANDMVLLNKARLYDNAVAKQKAGKQSPKSKALPAGNNNPSKPVIQDKAKAAAQFANSRSPADAAKLLAL